MQATTISDRGLIRLFPATYHKPPALRGLVDTDDPTHNALHADPALGYPEGQSFAENLRRVGSRGLIYPSVRAPEGSCLACFDPQAVQNVHPWASWDLT